MSRRDFITSVSAVALLSAAPPLLPAVEDEGRNQFVVVNGWVLRRNEVA